MKGVKVIMDKKTKNNIIAFVVTLVVSSLVFFGIIKVMDALEKDNQRKIEEAKADRAARKALDKELIDLDLTDLD